MVSLHCYSKMSIFYEKKLVIEWSNLDYVNDSVDLLFLDENAALIFLCDGCSRSRGQITSGVKLVAVKPENSEDDEEYYIAVKCVSCPFRKFILRCSFFIYIFLKQLDCTVFFRGKIIFLRISLNKKDTDASQRQI